MKVSEVIKELEKLKEKHGDLDCTVSYFYPKRTSESELKELTLEICTVTNDSGKVISEEKFISFIGKSENCVSKEAN